MSTRKVLSLASLFRLKLASSEDEASEKLHKIVQGFFPFVADNMMHNKGDHYEIVIELSNEPHYTSDRGKLPDEEFQKLIQLAANTLKTHFKVMDLSIRDTSSSFYGNEGQVVGLFAKVAK